jgi:membrane protein DedA with SNARE-associated domain
LARGNFTWVPYFVVVIVLVLLAALVWWARSRKARKTERSSAA